MINYERFMERFFGDFNPERVHSDCVDFVRRAWEGPLNKMGLIGGLSGGIDSAYSFTVATDAGIRPSAMKIPDGFRPDSLSITMADLMIDFLGIPPANVYLRDIKGLLDLSCEGCPRPGLGACDPRLCRGNYAARLRMAELFRMAKLIGACVLGTENFTEHMIGYFTIGGDEVSSVEPLFCLVKTEVRLLSKWRGLPEPVIARPPSADLYKGQTDEGEIGATYPEIDSVVLTLRRQRLLKQVVNSTDMVKSVLYNDRDLEYVGMEPDRIDYVVKLITGSEFKRRQKPTWDGLILNAA